MAGEKPADILINHYGSGGRHACIDVTVADSLEDFSTRAVPWRPELCLIRKENDKKRKYLLKCAERGLVFIPFVCGSLGGFGDDALTVIKRVGKAFGSACGLSPSIGVDILRKRLSFVIQKAQATAILRRGSLGSVLL